MKDKITENINDLTSLLDLEISSNNTKTNQIDTELEKAILECWENRPDSFNYVDIDPLYDSFKAKFGKDIIAGFTSNECLYNLFGNAEHDSLVYNLEKKREYLYFAKVGGWKTIYTLWKKIEDGQWYCRLSGNKTKQITEQEAEKIAEGYRNSFVSLFEFIESLENAGNVNTEEDYVKIDEKAKETLGILYDRNWVKKYLHMIFPNIFTTFFSTKWVKNNFNALGIKPKETYLLQCYQFSTIAKSLGIRNAYLSQILSTLFDFRDSQDDAEIEEDEDESDEVGCNKIFYGVPGCGKSWYVEHVLLNGIDEKNKFRTTFYLDYSNSDFVGQIYPSINKGIDSKGNQTSKVDYIRNPGPFTKALARAYSTKQHVYLVIEEINRGNAAAIFGDLFQLLDRLQEDKKDGRIAGDSEYPINNEFIEGYLKEAKDSEGNPINIQIPAEISKIYIPHNLTIYATMNTSDQNVFPLDTAFKRRWQRERVVTDWSDVADELKNAYVPGTDIKWQDFVQKINEAIVEPSDSGTISEDKQLGAYFVNKDMLTITPFNMDTTDKEEQNKIRNFINNVIDYLYNDVTKFDHKKLFNDKLTSYEKTYENVLIKHDSTYGLKCLEKE